MNEQGARPAATAGVMTAAAVIYALAVSYLPMLTMVLGMLWPVFIALICVRVGGRWGVLAAVASLLLMMLFSPAMTGALFVISFAPTGILLGMMLRRGRGAVHALLGGAAASLLGKLAAAALVFFLFGMNPMGMDLQMAEQAMDETLALYQSLGMSEEQISETRMAAKGVLSAFVLLLPSFFIVSALIEAFLSLMVLRIVLRRLGMSFPSFPPFTAWRLPMGFAYLFAFSLIGLYWGATRDFTLLYQAALNGYLIAFFAGLMQGLSFLQFLMKRFRVAPLLRVMLYVFIALSTFLAQVVSWTGLFDIVFDYRKEILEKKNS